MMLSEVLWVLVSIAGNIDGFVVCVRDWGSLVVSVEARIGQFVTGLSLMWLIYNILSVYRDAEF